MEDTHIEENINPDIPKKKKAHESMRENPWIVSTFVLGLLVVIMLVGSFGGMTGGTISESDAGQAILDFANSQGANAELVGVEKVGVFYEVTLLRHLWGYISAEIIRHQIADFRQIGV